jgi:hypothetical protein
MVTGGFPIRPSMPQSKAPREIREAAHPLHPPDPRTLPGEKP